MHVGGFEMQEKLGEGGMASVWKARQVSLDRIVAIKTLSSQMASDPADVERFQREAQSAAKLKHNGIVQVYDANMEDGKYYFVMEFVDGYTVGDWMRRTETLPEKDALLVASCVADALQYAWEKEGIIHCDIKPDNVMVDEDGTVKVADLGLARTISAMSSSDDEAEAVEIMGTPAYMSPEQARGDVDLDCRADIYSLGATLYHLVTGKMLFEGHADDEVIDLQITKSVDDALDINQRLSKGFCWFLEKMLAKDKDNRPKDWAEVITDIKRVKRKMLPTHLLKEEGLSTVRRSKYRTKAPSRTAAKPAVKVAEGSPFVKKLLIVGGICIAFVGLAVLLSQAGKSQQKRVARRPPPVQRTQPVAPRVNLRETRAKEMFDYARKWAQDNPDKFDAAIGQFQKITRETRGTKYALMAETEIRKISEQKDRKVDGVMASLKNQTSRMIKNRKFGRAAEVYDAYSGPLASESRERRTNAVRKLREYKAQYKKKVEALAAQGEVRVKKVLDDMVSKLMTAGLPDARLVLAEALSDNTLSGFHADMRKYEGLLKEGTRVEEKILSSFKAQAGKQVAVQLASGPANMVIRSVIDGKITGKQRKRVGSGFTTSTVVFEIKDLSTRERLIRMGRDTEPGVALMKGIMAYQSKAFSHARTYFGKVDPMLGEKLLAYIDEEEKGSGDKEAEQALRSLLRTYGISVAAFSARDWQDAIAAKTYSESEVRRIRMAAGNYEKAYAGGDFLKKAGSVLSALQNLKSGSTRSEPERAPLPLRSFNRDDLRNVGVAGEHAPVVAKLIEVNPMLSDRTMQFYADADGVLCRLEIASSQLLNISPLRELDKLKEVCLSAVSFEDRRRGSPRANLSSIGALRDLPLEFLFIGNTDVDSLSALEGMPLRRLYAGRTKIESLSPLRGMSLEVLDIRETPVKDLSVLKGMPLQELDASGTRAYDFRPLVGMDLKTLDVSNTQLKDLSFLRDSPLQSLNVAGTRVHSFTSIRNLPLRHLNLSDTQVRDLSFLRGKRLESLQLAQTSLKSISVLKGMPLRSLSLSGNTHVRDFGVLSDMPLVHLDLAKCRISDISILKGVPLRNLNIGGTGVSDLSPLVGAPIGYLNISSTPIRDATPLVQLPIRHLSMRGMEGRFDLGILRNTKIQRIDLDKPMENLGVLRAIPTLKFINGLTLGQIMEGMGNDRGRGRRRR